MQRNPTLVKGRHVGVRWEVAQWLRAAMRQGGIRSQVALATASGVSRETVNNILGSKVDPDPKTLTKLARACRVPVPTVEWRFSALGAPQNEETVLGWIVEARAALERAERLLEATAPPPVERAPAADPRDAEIVVEGWTMEAPSQQPRRKRGGGRGS